MSKENKSKFILPVPKGSTFVSRGHSHKPVTHPITKKPTRHHGIDFAPINRSQPVNVLSAQAGTVVYARRQGPAPNKGFGNVGVTVTGASSPKLHLL
jgi:murein DD-endopeptidase MepM/ murein hydrolase activator NlpD